MEFKQKLITVMYEQNKVLPYTTHTILTNLYYDINTSHRDKLEELYLKQQANLSLIDISVIVSDWRLEYVKKFCETLIDRGQLYIIHEIIPNLKSRDYDYANTLSLMFPDSYELMK